ncbi:MAG: dynamin family protein [Thermoleophilia bacterium]|nr:dynamin family protein [Thermoleophilia bacterium]
MTGADVKIDHRPQEQESPLDVVRDIQAAFHLDSLLPALRATLRLAAETRVVNVAVVGRFKAGKSSFLNQIVGEQILPVDVLPATAVITQLYYGPTHRVTVIYQDGRREQIPPERLAEFVTERENPENAKGVALVDIESPALAAFRGIRFVDTPGLGSIYTRTTQTSVNWLPEIGAAIVVLTLDPPLSEGDLNLIRNLTRFTPEITILLSKVDLAAPDQVERVKSFMQEEITKRLGLDLPIFPYSNKPEFAHLREQLREYLMRRIVSAREERLREIINHKVSTLLQECREYLEVALAAAEATEQARAMLLALLDEEEGHLGQIHAEIGLLAGDLKKRIHRSLSEGYQSLYPEVLRKVTEDFDQQSKTWRGNLAKTSQAFQEWASRSLGQHLSEVLPYGEEFIKQELIEAEGQLGRVVRAFQDRLGAAVERALGRRFKGATFTAEVDPPSYPDIKVDKTFDIPLDMIWFLVPMFIFRRLVYHRLRSQLPWEVEKNLTRVAWQWSEAAGRSVDQIARQAESFIRQEAATVRELASGSAGQVAKITSALARLEVAQVGKSHPVNACAAKS